jgi:hypothetical protein
MASKSLFSGIRASVVGSVLAAAGLAGCCDDPCAPKCEPCVRQPVYRSPCCPPGVYGGGGGTMMAPAPTYTAPMPAPSMGPSTPQASGYAGPGSQMNCGAGKCG